MLRFSGFHTHNSKDCSIKRVGGRYEITHRLDKRCADILSILRNNKDGFKSATFVAEALNEKYPGANYTYNDIHSLLKRLQKIGHVYRYQGLMWQLSAKGNKLPWTKVAKDVNLPDLKKVKKKAA